MKFKIFFSENNMADAFIFDLKSTLEKLQKSMLLNQKKTP
jgi:hypothetical protein